ncbi:MAG: DMT family transporter [Bacteroidales bacterium]|nr:DMT family transporter [Bacteroidales bacterium]MDY6406325.1 DMT family transporter [Bacteroidales bacterium]
MWTVLAFVSALCLGFYDISKKIALRENRVVDVLTISVCVSSLFLSIPLILSRLCPEMMLGTHFYVPSLDGTAHAYTILKSIIVLSSWFFGYISLKHLPISVVSPMQATRPMWTLVGALLLFNERLNGWQWVGILLAIGSIFVFSFRRKTISNALSTNTNNKYYYICLAFAIISGACSGLYDKYLMRQYDHNAVQVYYTFYQAIMMLIAWAIFNRKNIKYQISNLRFIKRIGVIVLISLFLIVSDNVYMLALRDPDSMIAVVSTIRRGGAVIGFAYGLLFLKEPDPVRKLCCMGGILAGLICLAMGSL